MHNTESKRKTIQQWKDSGLTQKAFCQQININVHTLHYWIRQLKDEAKPKEQFISLTPDTSLVSEKMIELKIGHAHISTSISQLPSLLLELDRAGLLYDPA